MGINATSSTSVQLPLNGLWLIEVLTTDNNGYAVSGTPTVTVTAPSGSTSTPTVEAIGNGYYRAAVTVTVAGRYVARATTSDDAVDFAAYVTVNTTGTEMPTTSDVTAYMEDGAASWTVAQLQDALSAEAAAQRAVCRVGAIYPADLRQALLRRVQRNLALRQLPLAVLQGDSETGSAILPGRDPEVRRLEAPYRKLVIG